MWDIMLPPLLSSPVNLLWKPQMEFPQNREADWILEIGIEETGPGKLPTRVLTHVRWNTLYHVKPLNLGMCLLSQHNLAYPY